MKGNLSKYILLLADLGAIVLAFRIAYYLRYEAVVLYPLREGGRVPVFGDYGYSILLSLGTWILIFLVYGVDNFPGLGESALAVSKLITASLFLITSLIAGMYFAGAYYSRLMLVFLAVLVPIFLVATRIIYRAALRHLRNRGVGLRRVVIVGHSELAAELGDRIARHLDLHYELVGYLSPTAARLQPNGDSASSSQASTTSMTSSEAMAAELARRNVHELLFAIPIRRETETLDFIAHCQQRGITIKAVPEYYDLHTSHIVNLRIDGIPILEMKETSLHPSHQFIKRIIDLALIVLTVPVTLPTLALVSATLYLGSRRVFRRERRVGLGGKPFILYQFDAGMDATSVGPGSNAWQGRFGQFIERYSISELPQVWNVLAGNMSFVGPQAESPERARYYSAWHRRRLQLKPGITGLAQVQGLRQVDSSDLKTKYDLEYAANYTPLVDLALVLATVSTLLSRRKGAAPGNGGSAPPRHSGPAGGFRPVSPDSLNISGN